ncbi:DUF4367 domain-containing protein [Gracilibacillus oryzae]|uniref:DUF4367 domain-containing protein n=1 Tax=Gracilibacillus oryzae TaxID=1672701 RepID=A0A7C8GRJ6_9BACI|nr:DUF4367 domain-containing protein [Gracilibacillus oryzae]KAB8127502.1 DUF4367 domain-containing protein [Gracilibacillus oryzae]
MKKSVCIVMTLVLILAGCNFHSDSKEFVDYDKEEITESSHVLTFNPEVPKLLPFEPVETNVDIASLAGMENNYITVRFINEDQEEITYRAGLQKNALEYTEEKVTITENVEGRYGENDGSKILKWDKNNIYYELFVKSGTISKEDMLTIAENFYLIR